MGSIFKRKRNGSRRDGVYEIEYTNEHGKRVRERGMTDRRLTEQLLADREDQVRLRTAGLVDPIMETLAQHRVAPIGLHIEDYELHLATGSRTVKHKTLTVGRIRKVVAGGEIATLADLQADCVEKFLHGLHEAGYGARTVNHYLQATRGFAAWLVRNNRLAANPLLALQPYNAEADVRHKRRALAVEEVRRLIDSARTSYQVIQGYSPEQRARLYELAYLTGLRRSELASLTQANFDLRSSQPTLTVAAACSKHRRQDTLPLHPHLVEVLPLWFQEHRPNELLFPKLECKKTWLMVKKDLERVGIPYETAEGVADFHASGRHSYVSQLFESGASITEARQLARHSDVKMTMRYTHVSLESQAKALASLPKPTETDSGNGSHIGRTPRRQASSATSRRGIDCQQAEKSAAHATQEGNKSSVNAWRKKTGGGDRSRHPLKSGGGGNRICEGFCDNELHDNELEQSQKTLGATGECVSGTSCQNSSLTDNEFAPSIAFIAQAWPHLAPHIREAIVTLIDASLPSRAVQGAQS